MGVDTHSNLKKIIDKITTVNFDTLLISGDLAHNGTPESYQILKEILSPLQNNLVIMPGNHDSTENLSQLFGKNLIPNSSLGDWEIITTNSVQVAQTSGFLTQNTLLNLDLSLKNTKAKYNVVVLQDRKSVV